MTLIQSISGIRGTIGGKVGDNLTPLDTVRFASAYGTWLKTHSKKQQPTVVVGRDARISGPMVQQLVMQSLRALGIHVVDLGLSTTPTVEIAVSLEKADGGIILTASHNPKEWNALKLLNNRGEFLDQKSGLEVLSLAKQEDFEYANIDLLGSITSNNSYLEKHIQAILQLPLVNVALIQAAGFKIVVDGVHSTGGIAVPMLLERLGATVVELYCEPHGDFPHNPEPLAEHLTDLSNRVVQEKADLGISVDPDVDRLALVCEDGSMFGEEYTLVACTDYVLSKTLGATVSNLSSSRALRDITQKYDCQYTASAVGEVHVVAQMKKTNAVIGGEGNGGVIYPELHYGRDALVGIALFLTHLATKKCDMSTLRQNYPSYVMCKNKMQLTPEIDIDRVLQDFEKQHANEKISTTDGVKIDYEDAWVHLRKSNTEPIIRIYTEAKNKEKAVQLATETKKDISLITSK